MFVTFVLALDMARSCEQKACGEVLRSHGGPDCFDETSVSAELFVKSQHMTGQHDSSCITLT